MATVVNAAFPAAKASPDLSVLTAKSVADPQINTIRTTGTTTTVGAFPATDSIGVTGATGIDFTKAGTDLSRP